jgi:hypothetical protein
MIFSMTRSHTRLTSLWWHLHTSHGHSGQGIHHCEAPWGQFRDRQDSLHPTTLQSSCLKKTPHNHLSIGHTILRLWPLKPALLSFPFTSSFHFIHRQMYKVIFISHTLLFGQRAFAVTSPGSRIHSPWHFDTEYWRGISVDCGGWPSSSGSWYACIIQIPLWVQGHWLWLNSDHSTRLTPWFMLVTNQTVFFTTGLQSHDYMCIICGAVVNVPGNELNQFVMMLIHYDKEIRGRQFDNKYHSIM